MKKVLITGASGFFGRNLITALEQDADALNYEYFCISKNSNLKFSNPKFKNVRCDLLNSENRKYLLQDIKADYLVHLAWYVPPQLFWNALENLTWLNASIGLFNDFCMNGGTLFIGAGSLAEYSWDSGLISETKTELKPKTLYGQSKKSLFEIIFKIRDTHFSNTKIIWPRIGYFFGAYEPKDKLLPKLIYSIKHNKTIDLAAEDFKRPYADVRYFAKIIKKLLLNKQETDLVFNLSMSKSYKLKKIVEFIENILNIKNNNIKYAAYEAQPKVLDVKTAILKNNMQDPIEDTFFQDLEQYIEMLK